MLTTLFHLSVVVGIKRITTTTFFFDEKKFYENAHDEELIKKIFLIGSSESEIGIEYEIYK
jgi:hypothetical protein